MVTPKGDSITSTYNALNRLGSISYNGVQKWTYGYDAIGNVTTINNIATGTITTNTYDENNRLTNVAQGGSNSFAYTYDDNGNVTALTATAGAATRTTTNSYNGLDQLTALARNSANVAKYVYDERGNVTSIKFADNTYSSFEYDAMSRLTLVKNYNSAATVQDSYAYTYDANGNRTSVTSTAGTINYQYDELNRQTQETLLDGTTIDYVYDAVGNRTSKTVTNGGQTVTNYTYNDGNELTAVGGQAYTYDANGNLTSNGTNTFVYNEINQLIQVKDSGGTVIASYTYDDQGKRINATASGSTTYYHYSGDKVIYTTDANNNIIADYTYDSQGNPATMTYNGTTYYYQINGHGDVMYLTNGSGNVAAQYTYDAWGNILSQSGSMASINPYKYAGYTYDENTGLYYLMARYYDADVGRFLTRDTFQGFKNEPLGLNYYAYCINNPVIFIDSDGHYAQVLIPVAAYAFALISLTVVSANDIAKALEIKFKRKNPRIIYRTGSGNGTNLTPRPWIDSGGLSYKIVKPLFGPYTATTMEAINATGKLVAIRDSLTHVSVRSVNLSKMQEWQNSRANANTNPHEYTRLLQALSVKVK